MPKVPTNSRAMMRKKTRRKYLYDLCFPMPLFSIALQKESSDPASASLISALQWLDERPNAK